MLDIFQRIIKRHLGLIMNSEFAMNVPRKWYTCFNQLFGKNQIKVEIRFTISDKQFSTNQRHHFF